MSAVTIYTAIRAMLLDQVDPLVFPVKNIQRAYQPPTSGNFISYWRLHAKKTGITGVSTYTYRPLTQDGIRSDNLLYENHIQVDFYSDDPNIANDNADDFYHYLTVFAPEFLRENYSDMSIGVVDEVLNNTDLGDKSTYLQRFTNRFTMFTHNILVRDQIFIPEIIIIPEFIA